MKKHKFRELCIFLQKSIKIFAALLITGILFSCATNPRISLSPEIDGDEFSLLPAGGLAYIWGDVREAGSLIELLLFEGGSRESADILNRTRYAAAALFPQAAGTEGRNYYLAAFGSYPRRSANISMMFSRDWRRQRSSTGSTYWYSRSSEMTLAMSSNFALVSDLDPFIAPSTASLSMPAVSVPDGFLDFRRGKALAGWINEAQEPLNSFLESFGLPIQIPAEELFFGALRLPSIDSSEIQWELSFKIKTSSDREARALISLFNIAMLFIQRTGQGTPPPSGTLQPMDFFSLLFGNPLEQDEEFIIIRSAPMNDVRVALLLGLFPIYSS